MDSFTSICLATIAATRSKVTEVEEIEIMPVDEEKSSGGLCVIA